jgi:hypothetical protein
MAADLRSGDLVIADLLRDLISKYIVNRKSAISK